MIQHAAHAHQKEAIQSELLRIFSDIYHVETSSKQKAAARKRYLARRGIETRQEKKDLERALRDTWFD
ncbi:MAG: hypothetical protein H7A01_00100 [Hahellaceae bacterium]|jgi:hypothetical protein|nr:hypothetical protein [Hahellaceae bacterium]MCP5210705.1 hypothetical protein [Hahellaceae bacterium]